MNSNISGIASSVLRTEEAKLLDLISKVSIRPAEFEDPFADMGGEEAFKHTSKSAVVSASPLTRKEMRRSMIRASMAAPPLIGSDSIESSYNRTVLESMQAMVAQSVEDMKAMQAEKDKEINRLNQKVKVLVKTWTMPCTICCLLITISPFYDE
jgi:hypothetical protein